jgi:hypothetical protein
MSVSVKLKQQQAEQQQPPRRGRAESEPPF